MRRFVALAVAWLATGLALGAGSGADVQKYELNIPRQSLDTALKDLAHQTGLQIARLGDVTNGAAMVGPVEGALTAGEALEGLLKDQGLTYKMVNERTVAVMRPQEEGGRGLNAGRVGEATGEGAQGQGQDQGSAGGAGAGEKVELQEILVTAQKKKERQQDVPMSMSVLDTRSLVENEQLTIADYYMSIPAVSIAPLPEGGMNLGIRGIVSNGTTGSQGSATTGVLIDGTPVGSGNLYVPDFDPGDLQRIEVLRGPQGTLYGASSMGGLLNYITKDPSTQGLSGSLTSGLSHINNGDGLGYTFRGSINAPVTSDLAIRANAFTKEDPGYIDNPYVGMRGVNVGHTSGGHVSLLWTPSDALSLKLSALYQRLTADSTSDITATNYFTGQPLGGLQQVYSKDATAYNHQEQSYGAVLKYKVGDLTISSNTGYNISDHHDTLDYSEALGFLAHSFYQVPAWTIDYDLSFKSFSEELRFAKPLGRLFDAQLSLYWNYSNTNPDIAHAWATDPLTGARTANIENFLLSGDGLGPRQDESAIFTDITYHATDKLDIQLGGRESRVRQFQNTTTVVVNLLNIGSIYSALPNAEEHPFTYLFSPQYKLSQDRMVYGRIATGFRPGVSNGLLAATYGAPPTVDPDKLTSYEVGSKDEFFDHKLSIDASVYAIYWKDIQLQLEGKTTTSSNGVPAGTTFQYTGNAGSARSTGVDLAIQARPGAGLTIAGWVAYDDAKITSFPANATGFEAAPGDRLPLSSKTSGNLSVDKQFSLWASMRGSVGCAASYVGGREGLFTLTPTRTYLPEYVKVDLRASVDHGPWRIGAYANNVADRRGVISGGLGNAVTNSFYYITPRTFGVSVSRSFE